MASPSFTPSAAVRAPSASFAGRCINHCRCVNLPLQRCPPPSLAARWGATRLAAGPLGTVSGRSGVRCGALVQIGQNEFAAQVLGAELPVLVEFVADWCGPCRLISSIVESASLEYKDRLKVVKIDHDANPELITEYKVYGLPTLILFRNGQEVPESRREGAITKVKLKEYLDNFLEPTSVS